LRPGQYWAVPLPNGRFACGRVIQIGAGAIPTPSRAFFGGLQEWLGMEPPTGESIAGSKIIEWGVMHIRAITETGGEILGERALDRDGIVPPQQLSSWGGPGTQLLRGAEPVGIASAEQWGKLPALGYWGTDFIEQLAIQRLAR
jgi:hypothetical protein